MKGEVRDVDEILGRVENTEQIKVNLFLSC